MARIQYRPRSIQDCHVSPPANLVRCWEERTTKFSPFNTKTKTRLFLLKKIVCLQSAITTPGKVLSRSSGGTCRSARRSSLVQLASSGTSAPAARCNVSKGTNGHVEHILSSKFKHTKSITCQQIHIKYIKVIQEFRSILYEGRKINFIDHGKTQYSCQRHISIRACSHRTIMQLRKNKV